jgi:hypothetical protein
MTVVGVVGGGTVVDVVVVPGVPTTRNSSVIAPPIVKSETMHRPDSKYGPGAAVSGT